MAVYLSEYVTDLGMPPMVHPVPHQFAMGDNNAYTFTALLCDHRDPDAELMSGTVSGELLRPDGETVALEGTKGAEVRRVNLDAGGMCNATPCSVTLPQACFAFPGRVTLTIKLTDGSTITQALSVSAVVVRTSTDVVVDPGEVIPDIGAIQAAAAEALDAAEAANDAAAAASTAMAGSVRFDQAQTLTDAQKLQARNNIGAGTGGGGGEGAVRYDEAQTLTDAQKTTARGNIAAASLVTSGTAFSQATQGGTTYDVQDARITPLDILSNGLCGFDAYGVAGTKTQNGYKFTKGIGNRVTINGSYGGGSYFSIAMGNGIVATTSSTLPDTFVHFALQKGHSYRVTANYVSGTIGSDTNDCIVRYYTKTGSNAVSAVQMTPSLYADITSGKTTWARYIQADATDATLFGYGFYIRGNQMTNLVIDFKLEDVTGENLAYQISGATPSIVAAAGSRYICSAAYVTSLSYTPSATGICSVRFVSGTTPTVLTLPQTVKMPDWWTGCEASRTYEISIEDGVYGVVTSWA